LFGSDVPEKHSAANIAHSDRLAVGRKRQATNWISNPGQRGQFGTGTQIPEFHFGLFPLRISAAAPPASLDVGVLDLAHLYAAHVRDRTQGTHLAPDFADAVTFTSSLTASAGLRRQEWSSPSTTSGPLAQ
jgi:hypothetical protein